MKRGDRKPLAAISFRIVGPLYSVLTAREVANGWHKHINSVYLACQTGRLVSRKTSGTYLISMRSAVRLWGKPLEREIHRLED